MTKTPIPLEEMIAKAIGLGRSTAATANALCLGSTSHTAGLAERAFANHARGKGLDECEDPSIDLLFELFAADIAREMTGTAIRIVEPRSSHDEESIIWCEAPVFTERGRDLQALQKRFQTYVDLRTQIHDRVFAEKYLMRQLCR